MQAKNYKKSYLLNLLQTIENDNYNLKMNKSKKIYQPAATKKGLKYNPAINLKSNKRFTPKALPDYSTAAQKMQNTDKTLYARNILKGHVEPDVINDILSTIDKNELDYLYSSGPFIISQLDKNYNKSSISPEIFIEVLQGLYNKQNKYIDPIEKNVVDSSSESGSDSGSDSGSSVSESDLDRIPGLDLYQVHALYEQNTEQNADALQHLEADAEQGIQVEPGPIRRNIRVQKKRRGARAEELSAEVPLSPKKSLKTSYYVDDIYNYKEFKSADLKVGVKKLILQENFDKLSPFFKYLGNDISNTNLSKLRVADLDAGFKKYFDHLN